MAAAAAAYSISTLVILTNNFFPTQIKRDTFARKSSLCSQVLKKRSEFQGKIEFMGREKFFRTMALHGDHDASKSIHGSGDDADGKEIEGLKEEVRNMLTFDNNTNEKTICLIDNLERLGLSYHFEKEIKGEIDRIFEESMNNLESMEDWDLYTVALMFRIFRQRGIDIFPCVFNKFKDENGELDKSHHPHDFKGLLSLYEATVLRKPGEEFLSKSAAFTKATLLQMMPNLNPILQMQVNHAFEQSILGGCPIAKTRDNIIIYEMEQNRNESLLKFAKLDYNYLLDMHKQELSYVRRWWKKLSLSKFSYSLDIVIESYYGTIGPFFEPQHSLTRIMATKTLVMNSVIEQIFDSYDSIHDLQIFTDAIQRWDVEEMYRLPNFMKIVYATLISIHEEYMEAMKKQKKDYDLKQAIEWWKGVTKSHLRKAKWISNGYVPKFDEYMENSMISTSCFLLIPTLLLGIESKKQEMFEFFKENPIILKTIGKISRLIYDMTGYEIKKEKSGFVNGVDCYMEEYGVSKEEAFMKFLEMAENARMELNEELLLANNNNNNNNKNSSASTPMEIEMMTRNKVYIVDNDDNGFTNIRKLLKSQIIAVLVDQI